MNNSNAAPEMNPRRPMRLACASRGWPGKWDCLFDLSREGNSLGNFSSRFTKLRNLNPGVEIFVTAGYVTFPRDEHSFVKVDASIERAMDSAES